MNYTFKGKVSKKKTKLIAGICERYQKEEESCRKKESCSSNRMELLNIHYLW